MRLGDTIFERLVFVRRDCGLGITIKLLRVDGGEGVDLDLSQRLRYPLLALPLPSPSLPFPPCR